MLTAGTLLEHSPDGIVLHDGEQIVAANAAALRLLGASSVVQLVGQPVSAHFEYPFLKGVERRLVAGQYGADLGAFVRERFYALDGSVHEVDAHAQVYLDGDRPSVFLVLHDVREQIAEQRRWQERHETARAAGSRANARQVAGGVAHVLNNRLQVILGFANLIAEGPLSSAQRMDLEQIIHAATEGAVVTRQLLESAGSTRCVREPVSLTVVVPTMVRDLEGPETGCEPPIAVEAGASPMVLVAAGHVRYMLTYLIANARRAIEQHGHIVVTVGEAVLRTPQIASDGQRMECGRYATVTVGDSGEGISPFAQFHMFEPFFTTTRIGEGHGLGLSAVQGLLRQNGGYLTFSSTPGRGSSFTLWFPAGGSMAGTLPAVSSAAILVVESDATARSATVRCLERVGYAVMEATTAAEAGEVLMHVNCPALVVAGRSVGRGEVALRQLRARCPTIPLLILAGDEVGVDATGDAVADDAGAPTSRLSEPYSDFVLVSRVRALIEAAELAGGHQVDTAGP